MKRFLLSTLALVNLFDISIQESTQRQLAENSTGTAPYKNVWSPLSEAELSSISAVLIQKLNLSTTSDGSGRDNTILQIDHLRPNKTEVLPFISSNGGEPKRYARATIQFGSPEVPYLQEYCIGPLPATNETAVEPLRFPFNNKKSGISKLASAYTADIQSFLTKLSSDVEYITRRLWNTTIAEGGIFPRLGEVTFNDDNTQSVWVTFINNATTGFDSLTLLPLGVFMRLDVTSRSWQDWFISGWFYHGQMYNSTTAFNSTVFASNFKKPPPNVDGPWTSTDKQKAPLPLDDLPPPKSVSQGANRYTIDEKENFVSWMDFTFFLSTSTDQGVSLFNIGFKKQRIIYELALQEALAHYAGSDPVQSETIYFDSQEGMGRNMVPLIKGFDCPSYATFLNATFSEASTIKTTQDTICIFEEDENFPLRRHYSPSFGYVSAAKNIVLTVRWISTVGNYDYLFDYKFYYDGAIEVQVRASGYILGAYYADNEEYGFRIHDALSGSLHDHVMTFKADFDIFGEKNSVQSVEVVPATVVYPWSQGQPHNTMKLERSFVTTENESSINWAPNDAIAYSIVNKDSPNKYGEYPGYKFKRSGPTAHLTVKNSTIAGNAAHYTSHDFFVTRQKDSEPYAADRNNYYDIADPLVDFSKFFDGESLKQEDLVLWINMGMHHTPHTGDLPNTIMTSAHSGIRFEPLNYLEYDPSIETSQQIRVNLTSG